MTRYLGTALFVPEHQGPEQQSCGRAGERRNVCTSGALAPCSGLCAPQQQHASAAEPAMRAAAGGRREGKAVQDTSTGHCNSHGAALRAAGLAAGAGRAPAVSLPCAYHNTRNTRTQRPRLPHNGRTGSNAQSACRSPLPNTSYPALPTPALRASTRAISTAVSPHPLCILVSRSVRHGDKFSSPQRLPPHPRQPGPAAPPRAPPSPAAHGAGCGLAQACPASPWPCTAL